MLNLVTGQDVFKEFLNCVEWHDGSVLETHSVLADGTDSILRMLIDPCKGRTLIEAVFFAPEYVDGPHGSMIIDLYPRASIKRRQVEFTLCTCKVVAACMAYRLADRDEAEIGGYFAKVRAYGAEGNLIHPYDLDWPTKMDLAFADRS